MKVEVGKYTINSDQYCYWITTRRKNRKWNGKDPEKEFYNVKVAGYSAKIEDLLDDFIENVGIKNEDARTAGEILENITKAKRDALKILNAACEQPPNGRGKAKKILKKEGDGGLIYPKRA